MNISFADRAKYSSTHPTICGKLTTYIARFRPSHDANSPENSEPIAWHINVMLPDRQNRTIYQKVRNEQRLYAVNDSPSHET